MTNNFNPSLILWIILTACLYLLPTMIAYWRGHGYRHVIFALNILGGMTGIGWIVAIIWAVWPSEKSLADPLLGNVTGTGFRNAGDTMGAVSYGQTRGFNEERQAYESSRRTTPVMQNDQRRC